MSERTTAELIAELGARCDVLEDNPFSDRAEAGFLAAIIDHLERPRFTAEQVEAVAAALSQHGAPADAYRWDELPEPSRSEKLAEARAALSAIGEVDA